jgi:predicted RNA binding protein YcfA (HicA-like mRNA interferase family)
MPELKRLSGKEVQKIFKYFGFKPISQRGSHVKIRRILETGQTQTLVVPAHDELDRGTLQAIIRQATRFIAIKDLKPHFYHE